MSKMSPALADLLAALHETVNIPLPAGDPDNDRKHHRVATDRLSNASVILHQLAGGGEWTSAQLRGQAKLLREFNAPCPVNYEPFKSAAPEADEASTVADIARVEDCPQRASYAPEMEAGE